LRARLLAPPGTALIYACDDDRPQAKALRARGAELVARPGAQGQVDLHAVLADLAERGMNEIHVEAGPALNGALLLAGLVDELLLYIAPRLLGSGKPIAELPPWERIDDAPAFRLVDAVPMGDDLRLRLRHPAAPA
jgi:diaminohydroxyphosphoribosylaminopyrimidine deaminase/5-amino-6-(5-phosphoribosylamino)uracil reductase